MVGAIESTSGGFKFPDATTQSTAASDGVKTCPSGFTMIGTAGKRGIFCIDTTRCSALAWFAAKDACRGLNLTEGRAVLCSHDDWYDACKTGTPTGMGGTWEWIAEFTNFSATAHMISAGGTNCLTVGDDLPTGTYGFRCCIH